MLFALLNSLGRTRTGLNDMSKKNQSRSSNLLPSESTSKKQKVSGADSDDEEIDSKIGISDRFRAQIDAIASLKSSTQGSSKKAFDDSVTKVHEKLKQEVKTADRSAKEKLNAFLRDHPMDFDSVEILDRSLKSESALTKKSLNECYEHLSSNAASISGVFTLNAELVAGKAKDIKGSTAVAEANESRIILDFEKKADKAHKKALDAFKEVNIIASAAR